MKYIIKVLFLVVLVLLVFFTFRSWFTMGLLAGGDFQVYYKEMFHNFSFFPPPAWNWTLGTGLGVNGSSLLWNYIVVQLPIVFFGNLLGFDWVQIQRVGYLYPYLILSIALPYYYARKLFPPLYAFLGMLIFSFNTYILMLVGGGQIFLSLAYILIPPVLYYFYQLLTGENKNTRVLIKTICLSALLFSLQALFDIRIAYVTLILIFLFACINIFYDKKFKNILFLPLVLFITGLLHAFWVLPTAIVRENPLSGYGAEYASYGMVNFLSFAKLENTISLLHPNWPENIFGKSYFMRPEFLLLPILAFSSLLLFTNEKKRKKELVMFFTLVALIGAFLSKGTNEPFGGIYNFLFTHIPGFMMFRDPTKWYTLVAVSYSVLIPFTVSKAHLLFAGYKQLPRYTVQKIFMFFTIVYLVFLIRPAWMGQLDGIFKNIQNSAEYIKLEQFLSQDKNFYRTFWIPKSSLYSFYSPTHPIVIGSDFTREYSISKIIEIMQDKGFEKILQDISVKYVIVPDDIESTIFLTDRKYDEKIYSETVNNLRNIPWLKEINCSTVKLLDCSDPIFGKIAAFEVSNPKDHFWTNSKTLSLKYTHVSPAEYVLVVENAKKGDTVIFSENYDPKWVARTIPVGRYQIASAKYEGRFNSFVLPQDGNY
ncbi:MAG: hypothetical protein ABH812_04210, partial [bacterium]